MLWNHGRITKNDNNSTLFFSICYCLMFEKVFICSSSLVFLIQPDLRVKYRSNTQIFLNNFFTSYNLPKLITFNPNHQHHHINKKSISAQILLSQAQTSNSLELWNAKNWKLQNLLFIRTTINKTQPATPNQTHKNCKESYQIRSKVRRK